MSESDEQTVSAEREEIEALLGKGVVLDTRGPIVYLGTLSAIGEWFMTLTDADVHDLADSSTSKEVYIMETAKHGVRKNRSEVYVRKSEVVSLSALESVVRY